MDYYNTLGVDRNASSAEIKKAYRSLAMKHHPDRGGNAEKFKQIEEAYRTLGDDQARAAYDNPGPQFGQGGPFPSGPGGFHFNFNMNDVFSQFFGQQGGFKHTPTYRTIVNISLEQAYNGGDQVLKLQTQHNTNEVIKIDIPKGIDNGNQIRYDNVIQGASLIVEYRIQPNLKYERHGPDLYTNVQISVLDLIVGTTLKVVAISGKTFEVKVPAKSQPNLQLKMTGYGMPILNTPNFGDQIIVLKPTMPDTIADEITNSILRSKQN